jgi:hypothetical protein
LACNRRVAAALAHLTGLALGPLFIVPLFVVALQMSYGAPTAALTQPAPGPERQLLARSEHF